MALTTYHSASDVEELVPTEKIDRFIARAEFAPTTAQAIVWLKAGKGSIAHKFPRFNAFSVPAGTKTEGADFTLIETDTTEESITPGFIGFGFRISDEAEGGVKADGRAGLAPDLIIEAINALNDRIDSDALAGSTSATNITGADTDYMTYENFLSAVTAWKALKVRSSTGLYAFGLSDDAAGDLLQDLGLGAAAILSNPQYLALFGPESGYMGSLHGFQLFNSPNISTTGSGRSNFITPMGPRNSGLGMVQNEPPNIRVTRGDTMELAAGTQYVARAWVGLGMTNRNRILEVLGRD